MDVEPFKPFMPNENARKWAEALESGAYQQATGALEQPGRGFCCLGVACRVAIDHGVPLRISSDGAGAITYDGHSGSLPTVVRAWLGLRDNTGTYRPTNNLATDNDNRHHDFKRIAQTIRTTPSLYQER